MKVTNSLANVVVSVKLSPLTENVLQLPCILPWLLSCPENSRRSSSTSALCPGIASSDCDHYARRPFLLPSGYFLPHERNEGRTFLSLASPHDSTRERERSSLIRLQRSLFVRSWIGRTKLQTLEERVRELTSAHRVRD